MSACEKVADNHCSEIFYNSLRAEGRFNKCSRTPDKRSCPFKSIKHLSPTGWRQLDWYLGSGSARFSSDGLLALTKHGFRKAFRFIAVAVWRTQRGNFHAELKKHLKSNCKSRSCFIRGARF